MGKTEVTKEIMEIMKNSNINIPYEKLYSFIADVLLYTMKSSDIDSNALLFWGFMNVHGFDPYNYKNILELIQSVPNSISQYLKDYKHFLLSENVRYEDLKTYGIEGARGYIDKNVGVIVPKSNEADEYFRSRQNEVSSTQISRYIYPTITDFDSIVSYCDFTSGANLEQLRQIMESVYFPFSDRYIGFITDKDDERLSKEVDLFSDILTLINKSWSQKQYILVHDTVSNKNKELYLIKKK